MDEKLKEWFGEAYDEEAGTLRVKLGQGAKINGQDADEVVLSEPVLGAYESALKIKAGIERDRHLMALVAGTTPGVYAMMPVTEYSKAMAFLTFFTNAGPPIGESGSES